ncbi:MAG: ABC transporter substrate-binding protein [Oscillibacter sp.]|nr:ABC transporter substrate-binding protein [Oscillibacter sp.]
MKRTILCLLALLVLLAACSSPPPAETAPSPAEGTEPPAADSAGADDTGADAAASTAVTFTDALDREITVDRPQRVAVLIGSFTDIWVLAGGQDQLTASAGDAWVGQGLDLPDTVANLGGSRDLNLELLLDSDPDFIIASANTKTGLDLQEFLDQTGVPYAYFIVNTFEDYLDMLNVCTQITGCTENYQTYGLDVQKQVEAARAMADGSAPRVLYVRASGSSVKVKNSEDSVLGEMLADLGCENIADSATSLLENLSMEVILEQDPDYIFAVVQGTDNTDAENMLNNTLLTDPAWNTLTAVQNGRFHVMDQALYNLKPNAEWGIAYENLARILYP